MYFPQEIIRKKRNGFPLTREEIDFFIRGITDHSISEGQIGAFAMAVYFQGMNREELISLVLSMRDSGNVLEWQSLDLEGPVVDKHSTGGVGDVVSLILGPIIAACGGFVPMISGRGLGHTGGTLDKLDAIPGYDTTPETTLFRKVVKNVGIAVIGQTGDLAPADKRLYAVRDVTATVESIPLITASILSKKLAAGIDALVMDVKTGNGAFMQRYGDAEKLAKSIVSAANGAGCKTIALLTDMNQVLASSAGNGLEVREAVRFLTGTCQNHRLHEVVMALSIDLLTLSNLVPDAAKGRERIQQVLDNGRAAEVFGKMVAALGGPVDFVEKTDNYLEKADIVRPVFAPSAGWVQTMDTRTLGMAIVALGGGRQQPDDTIDHAVGLSEIVSLGDQVDCNSPLAVVHARTETGFLEAKKSILQAMVIGSEQPSRIPQVLQKIGLTD